MLAFIQANGAVILGVLLGISEALAQIPQIKANSIFELVLSLLTKLSGKSSS